MVEFLEKLGVGFRTEQWIVRAGGVVRNAHVHLDDDVAWLREIETHTKPWLGFSHPRVAEIHSLSWSHDHLVIVTGDERGRLLVHAARHLTDAREREAWAAAEVLAIADAIATMAKHQRGLVHQRIFSQTVINAEGYARLRAPIAFVQAYKPGTYVGRGNSMGSLDGLSPEQIEGRSLTPASDVFSLATLLYTAIALRRPFAGTNDGDFERMVAIRDAVTPRPPSDSLAIWAVLERALAKDAAARYRTPAEFADALRCAVDPVPPASALAKLTPFVRGSAGPAPSESVGIVGYRCTKTWNQLATTSSEGIRYCGECKHDVVEVRSLNAVIPLLGKHCIAYRPE